MSPHAEANLGAWFCCSSCWGVVLLGALVLAVGRWRAGRLTGDNLRSVVSAWAATFAVGFLPGTLLFTVQYARDAHGERQLVRLIDGDTSVGLSEVEVTDYARTRTLVCDDPEVLRYLEDRLRTARADREPASAQGYSGRYVTFRFRDGGRIRMVARPFEGGFGVYVGKDSDVGMPNANVLFTEPMPAGLRAVVVILKDEQTERRVRVGPAE